MMWIDDPSSRQCSRGVALCILVCVSAAARAGTPQPVNPGFEEAAPDGSPVGWTVLHGLDRHGYGPPAYRQRFDAIRPLCGRSGYRSQRCLSFPTEGVWECPVFTHSNGDGKGIDGRRLGKAAVHQTVRLPAGRYRFAAWMRTAEGHLYSAAFALGVNTGEAARYADDESTGIHWTRGDLAMSRTFLRDVRSRGEWARYTTEPFALREAGPVTVWIRFQYVNENQMRARWQVDDAAIESADETASRAATHSPCPAAATPVRCRQVPGDLEDGLLDAGGSTLIDASKVRLFRRARSIPPGSAVTYRLALPGNGEPIAMLAALSGEATVDVNGSAFRFTGASETWPISREWVVPDAASPLQVTIRPTATQPVRLLEIEAGRPGRTVTRLHRVEADTIAVPWTIGCWDASAGEYGGARGDIADPAVARPEELSPSGRWTITFQHKPIDGHRYYVIHGLLGGTGRLDVGGDGLVDWVAESKGEEIVNFDATDLLRPGPNIVVIEADGGRHDFAALVEVCPGSTDLRKLRVCFEGDALAERFTRVIDNTWFWLRELHEEPSGFIDASVPRGHWYSQYWPVDMAFALREWVRWGYHDASLRTARLTSGRGWHGDSSNLSGGADNTGGNILVLQLCEILRRSNGTPDPQSVLWQRVRAHCAEIAESSRQSPHGLIRGTNWENAGNRENGPCYALSTTLGAAASLRKAAQLAAQMGTPEEATRWRATAANLRAAVLKHLVLPRDHRCPSGFVLPAGTWAYGLRTDGSVEDRPLAGYFWAAGDLLEADGLLPDDRELLAVYDRTLRAALPLFSRNERNVVSGYAASYDGPNAALIIAALCDRIDVFDLLLRKLAGETDTEEDIGSEFAELSRWAYGAPRDAEDTNLVCAAGFLWALRVLVGIDDAAAGDRQIRLVPRLPWQWTRLTVNDWPVRVRDTDGKPRWTNLRMQYERSASCVRLTVHTQANVPGLEVRLGPFAPGSRPAQATVNGRGAAVRSEVAGDAAWGWVGCDSDSRGVIVEARVPTTDAE